MFKKRCFHLEHLQNQTLEEKEKYSACYGKNVFKFLKSRFLFYSTINDCKIFREINTKTVSKHSE